MSNNLRVYSSQSGEGDDMYVTAFVGGEYGNSAQITIKGAYCALAENQVRDLITVLQKRIRGVRKYQATSLDIELRLESAKKEIGKNGK